MSQYSRAHRPGSGSLHRCFYALTFGGEITSYLSSIITELQQHHADVRWVPDRNIHLTLRFLGEITSEQLDAARTIPNANIPPHALSLCARGLGAFPLLRAPRIFWAGIDGESQEDMDRLLHLQRRSEEWARAIGVPPEYRRYVPHITLGRVAQPSEGLKGLTDDIIGRECQSAYSRIAEIVLFRSRLASTGPSYEIMERWSLGEG